MGAVVPVTRKRKRSSWHYLRKITRQVWQHPANRKHRVAALMRACRWQLYKRLVGQPQVINVYDGMKLTCHTDSASASNVIYFTELFDYDEMTFTSRYLRPGDGYIDCGANIGVYTLFASSCVGSSGHVEAIEPSGLSVQRLRENVALNGLENVTVHPIAVSDKAGVVRFLAAYDVSNRIAGHGDSGKTMAEVRTARLDEIVDPNRRYAMAKLDVEGAEFAALKGASRLLRDHNPPVWQFEIMDHLLRRQGSNREELLSLFSEHAYEFVRYDPSTASLASIDCQDPRHCNFLAVWSERRKDVERLCREQEVSGNREIPST